MKFYDEKNFLKLRNLLIIAVLALLTILLFFKVYDYFAKPIRLVISTIFVICNSILPYAIYRYDK